jgi:NAD(P)-dependent dehydrogenase (short-subunit alcohol dehydrogenase family)
LTAYPCDVLRLTNDMNQLDDLQGKTALVTGASRTLGVEIARALAGHGVNVGVHYHQSERAADQLCNELHVVGVNAVAFQADLNVPDPAIHLIDRAWEALGPLDILVNNYGPYVDTPFLDLPLGDFEHILNGNLRATFVLCQRAGKRMQARRTGCIVNIAATDAAYRNCSVYGLAKAGITYLTEALALELAPNVRINAVAPDLIADNEDMSPALVESAVADTPLARLVTREEIARMVCLICTGPFGIVTGQTVVMDGGHSLPRRASQTQTGS